VPTTEGYTVVSALVFDLENTEPALLTPNVKESSIKVAAADFPQILPTARLASAEAWEPMCFNLFPQ
jgi:hypothetical protein